MNNQATTGGSTNRARSARGRRAASSRGVTLLEILLVLALLVMVGALALPQFRGSLQRQKLLKMGEQVRVEWARARIEAMQSGRVYMFRYKVGEREYQIEPWQREEDMLEGSLNVTGQMTGQGMVGAGGLQQPQDMAVAQKALEEGIVFGDLAMGTDPRSLVMENQAQTSGLASPTEQNSELSPPVMFYPDGTTSMAQLVLYNERGYSVIVELRDLTGMSRLSDVQPPVQ